MSAHRVDLDQLLDTIDRMSRFATHLTASLDEADRRVGELHATWSGDAAQEQRVAHAQWRSGAQDLHEALTVMHRIAQTAHANYRGALEANQRMWRL